MSISSNLYAEKVFAEHPIGLWTIDERLHYPSLISDAYRQTSGWTTISGSVTHSVISDSFAPFSDSGVYQISGTGTYSINGALIDIDTLDQELGSVTISCHVKVISGTPSSISIGIKTASSTLFEEFSSIIYGDWLFFTKTFSIPAEDFSVYFAVNSTSSSVVAINGLSVGQWSSSHAFSNLGFEKETLPAIHGISGDSVKIEAYGISSNDGYALFDGNRQLVRSSGIPIVYGTKDSASVYKNSGGLPSIVFPGLGFMNESGKSSEYTLEFWLKIQSSSKSKRRIAGPIASQDGVYVDGPFIGFYVGNEFAYHYVGEWARPMLVQLTITETSATMYINGDTVASIVIDSNNYPDRLDVFGTEQDWIGFYAYDDLDAYQLECVSIYPYVVTDVLSKRRFVYGQGVDTMSSINSSFNGASIVFDSKFLKKSVSYSYPGVGFWSQGIVENVVPGDTRLSSPNFSLPAIVTSGRTYQNWLSDTIENFETLGNVVSLKPNQSWQSAEACILFDRLSQTNSPIRATYGVFEATQTQSSQKTLIRIFDKATNAYLSIDLDGTEVVYILSYNGQTEEICRVLGLDGVSPAQIGLGEAFAVGIDIDSFIEEYGGSLAAFFGNRSNLSISFGGSTNLENTFDGFIHRIGFCSQRNFAKVSSFFNTSGTISISEAIYDGGLQGNIGSPDFDGVLDGGFAGSEYPPNIFEHVATYTLFCNGTNRVFDIATDSYWEDYVPLSRLSRSTTDVDGQIRNIVDTIQFNIDYPRSQIISDSHINTNNEIVRTYISFQNVQAPNKSFVQLPNTVDVPANLLVIADDNWQTTRYEVVDGCTIIPPSNVDTSELSINVHIEIKTPGVLSKSVSIRSLSLIGKSFDYGSPSPIGTKFAGDGYPYIRYGVYNTYWSKVPFSVYKNSSPYLYLTCDYGVLINSGFSEYESGIAIPVNESGAANTAYSSIGLFINPEYSAKNNIDGPIIKIDFGNSTNYIVAEQDGFGRYRIYLANENLEEISSAVYFVNDVPTSDAYVLENQWSYVAVVPSIPFDFSDKSGAIRILSGMRVGSLSAFRMSTSDIILFNSFEQLTLPKLLTESKQHIYWGRKRGTFGSRNFGADPIDVYDAYTGTNRFVVTDNSKARFGNYEYAIYKNLSPATITVTPI